MTILKQKEILRQQAWTTTLDDQDKETEMIPWAILPFINESTYKTAKFVGFGLNVETGHYKGFKFGSLLSNFTERNQMEKLLNTFYNANFLKQFSSEKHQKILLNGKANTNMLVPILIQIRQWQDTCQILDKKLEKCFLPNMKLTLIIWCKR